MLGELRAAAYPAASSPQQNRCPTPAHRTAVCEMAVGVRPTMFSFLCLCRTLRTGIGWYLHHPAREEVAMQCSYTIYCTEK